jgi:hypothetical protein
MPLEMVNIYVYIEAFGFRLHIYRAPLLLKIYTDRVEDYIHIGNGTGLQVF